MKIDESKLCSWCGSEIVRSESYGFCSDDCHNNHTESRYWEDDDDDSDEVDDFENAMDECGQMSDGFCSMAGSEYCEFECPFRDEMFEAE